MELAKILLEPEPMRETVRTGEIFPDPNLVWNIDHLDYFIDIEMKSWKEHSKQLSTLLEDVSEFKASELLLDEFNVRYYLKSLFSVTTYYIACFNALDKLTTQLQKINTHNKFDVRKPKPVVDANFHAKAKFIRDKSFVHQDSEKLDNIMDKRTAMFWSPNISHKTDSPPTPEDYVFGDGKWHIEVNGIRTEAEIDITVKGLSSFADTAKTQILIRKQRIVEFYTAIKRSRANKQS
jgi:hypothetical protein